MPDFFFCMPCVNSTGHFCFQIWEARLPPKRWSKTRLVERTGRRGKIRSMPDLFFECLVRKYEAFVFIGWEPRLRCGKIRSKPFFLNVISLCVKKEPKKPSPKLTRAMAIPARA